MSTMIASGYTALRKLKRPGSHMFWAWIAYQTVKGLLTTSLIWVPLFWLWLS
ncbi:MAG: hypothetical protein AAGC70_04520 [Pseudomonadota bacterium]